MYLIKNDYKKIDQLRSLVLEYQRVTQLLAVIRPSSIANKTEAQASKFCYVSPLDEFKLNSKNNIPCPKIKEQYTYPSKGFWVF